MEPKDHLAAWRVRRCARSLTKQAEGVFGRRPSIVSTLSVMGCFYSTDTTCGSLQTFKPEGLARNIKFLLPCTKRFFWSRPVIHSLEGCPSNKEPVRLDYRFADFNTHLQTTTIAEARCPRPVAQATPLKTQADASHACVPSLLSRVTVKNQFPHRSKSRFHGVCRRREAPIRKHVF